VIAAYLGEDEEHAPEEPTVTGTVA
jgi:hypothetical protein